MVPRPRPPKGLDRPAVVRDRGRAVRPHPGAPLPGPRHPRIADGPSPVAVTRTPLGWAVIAACGSEPVDGLVEGLTLADLVVEELGGSTDPDRSARRSARGAAPTDGAPTDGGDPRDTRIAALERTVAQLEHALAARVATERAIGMLVERHGVSPRDAFDALRQEARAQSRPVQELAREVLDGISDPGERLRPSLDDDADADALPAAGVPDGRS